MVAYMVMVSTNKKKGAAFMILDKWTEFDVTSTFTTLGFNFCIWSLTNRMGIMPPTSSQELCSLISTS